MPVVHCVTYKLKYSVAQKMSRTLCNYNCVPVLFQLWFLSYYFSLLFAYNLRKTSH